MNCQRWCKFCFTIMCIVITISMVGYWFYKFAAEDRDIGVVDYQSFEESSSNPFPVVTFCFDDIFIPSNMPNKINVTEYTQYLQGEFTKEIYGKIDYSNITMDLGDYFLYGQVKWSNETIYRDNVLVFTHTNNFNGFYYWGSFRKCFEVSSNIEDHRYVKEVNLFYNKSKLLSDLESDYPLSLFFNIHYPGQFLLAPNDPTHININEGWDNYNVWIEDVELLKSRNSQRRTCTPDIRTLSYDNQVLQKHIKHNGCRPPYLRQYKEFPVCKTQKKLKDAMYSFNEVRRKYIPISCNRISKIYYSPHEAVELEVNSTWSFLLVFPDYHRIITQSKEVDIHSLIGNIGGYVGFFLGHTISTYIPNIL